MKITERVQYYLQEASLEIKGILKDSGTKIKKINSNIHRFCSTNFEKLTAKVLEFIVKDKNIVIAEKQFKNDPKRKEIIQKIKDHLNSPSYVEDGTVILDNQHNCFFINNGVNEAVTKFFVKQGFKTIHLK